MGISVYAHIMQEAEVSVKLREGKPGKYAALSTGDLSVIVHSREKALGLASLLERAAQQWEGES